MEKYIACNNSRRNSFETGIRGNNLGTKLESLP